MLVWLTDWQLAEDLVLIRVGDVVDWTLYEADQSWLFRLFASRLSVEWQFDTYADAEERASRHVRGEVIELQSARCRQVTTNEGRVPVAGEAQLSPVEDTSASCTRKTWQAESEPSENARKSYTFGYFSSGSDDDELDYLYGYVLSLKLNDDGLADRPMSMLE